MGLGEIRRQISSSTLDLFTYAYAKEILFIPSEWMREDGNDVPWRRVKSYSTIPTSRCWCSLYSGGRGKHCVWVLCVGHTAESSRNFLPANITFYPFSCGRALKSSASFCVASSHSVIGHALYYAYAHHSPSWNGHRFALPEPTVLSTHYVRCSPPRGNGCFPDPLPTSISRCAILMLCALLLIWTWTPFLPL